MIKIDQKNENENLKMKIEMKLHQYLKKYILIKIICICICSSKVALKVWRGLFLMKFRRKIFLFFYLIFLSYFFIFFIFIPDWNVIFVCCIFFKFNLLICFTQDIQKQQQNIHLINFFLCLLILTFTFCR